MARARGYCFTLNNYSEEEEQAIKEWKVQYLTVGREVGQSHTPHLQGYVYFADAKTLTALKKIQSRAHWEKAYGTPDQAALYCQKEHDFYEIGERPKTQEEKGQGEKRAWADAFTAVQEGRLEDVRPDILCTRLSSIEYAVERVRQSKLKIATLDDEFICEWHYGPAGTGKSAFVRAKYPDAFIKDPTKGWWDGYKGEEVVIIEDWDPFQYKQGGDLKRWLDRYPFQAEVKRGYQKIRPRLIIVTSQYTIAECFNDQQAIDAISRRSRLVIYYLGDEPGPDWSEVHGYDVTPMPPLFTDAEMDAQLAINIGNGSSQK